MNWVYVHFTCLWKAHLQLILLPTPIVFSLWFLHIRKLSWVYKHKILLHVAIIILPTLDSVLPLWACKISHKHADTNIISSTYKKRQWENSPENPYCRIKQKYKLDTLSKFWREHCELFFMTVFHKPFAPLIIKLLMKSTRNWLSLWTAFQSSEQSPELPFENDCL